MKLVNLFEQEGYTVSEIDRNDNITMQQFSDFYNQSGQLSWSLNPQRLRSKLGPKGSAFGLYYANELVGTIALKQTDMSGLMGAEVGYLMVAEEHRSLPNVMSLYKAIIADGRRFDVMFVTTNVKNKAINTLLKRTNKFIQVMKIKSPYSANQLFVWSSTISNGRYSEEEKMLAVKDKFFDNIIQEY